MIVLSGGHVVLPDRVLTPGTVVIDGDRLADVRAGSTPGAPLDHQYIVPGFIDVHVHGVEGFDTLDHEGRNPVAAIAARLPRYGVTSFCPTTVACAPDALAGVLKGVRQARTTLARHAARVLPAHLESNFISPEFRGAQPLECLRSPRNALLHEPSLQPEDGPNFSAADLLAEIERSVADVGIVTVAPELDGAIDLIRWIASRGPRVSLGHSGAAFDVGVDAIAAGARHATHLFNRMPPLGHRAPGLAGAVLQSDDVAAELICDGYHVHPALVRTAIAVKGASRIMAITDGTALSGLAVGAQAMLGGRVITADRSAALLVDGTLAGSTLTMDRAFRMLVSTMNLSLVDAATVCSTTPARALRLAGYGVLETGGVADLVVLDQDFSVVATYVGGEAAYSRGGA